MEKTRFPAEKLLQISKEHRPIFLDETDQKSYHSDSEGGRAMGNTDLIHGNVAKGMLIFAIPIFFSNLFQQLYNAVDVLVVGNFLGEQALAAVGSSGSLIFLLTGFVNGVSMGAGVVIARCYGARDHQRLFSAVHTTAALGLAAGCILSISGVLLSPLLLRLMDTPADVIEKSTVYFRIYFAGCISVVMYNCGAGILQSVGDSRHPMQYLITASLLNILLDLLLIGVMKMDVGGAALATVVSQSVSAGLVFYRLCRFGRAGEPWGLIPKKIRFYPGQLSAILHQGIPSGVQNSVISIANVIVQANINAFGSAAMAGCGAYSKIEGFSFLPVTCFTMALATFVGQNVGAAQPRRVRQGMVFGCLSSALLAGVTGLVIASVSSSVLTLFSREPEVIAFGVRECHVAPYFYSLLAFSHCAAAIMRGMGRPIIPMAVMLGDWCVFRILYITFAVKAFPVIETVFWAYPLTWSISAVIFSWYLLRRVIPALNKM